MFGLDEGLLELLVDYVNRKFTVLTDLTERTFSMHQGVLSTSAWTKMRAIKTMRASLDIAIPDGSQYTCCYAPSHEDGSRGSRLMRPRLTRWQ